MTRRRSDVVAKRILLALAALVLIACGEGAIQVDRPVGAGMGGGGAATGGTGGAAATACEAPATVSRCGGPVASDRVRLFFTEDGEECVICVDSTKKQFFGCALEVSGLNGESVNARCTAACVACPVKRCFSTGSDLGAEVPCS